MLDIRRVPLERAAMFSRKVPMGKVAIVVKGIRAVTPGSWTPGSAAILKIDLCLKELGINRRSRRRRVRKNEFIVRYKSQCYILQALARKYRRLQMHYAVPLEIMLTKPFWHFLSPSRSFIGVDDALDKKMRCEPDRLPEEDIFLPQPRLRSWQFRRAHDWKVKSTWK